MNNVETNKLIYESQKKSYIVSLLAAIILLIGSILLLFTGAIIIGIIGVLFFGSCLVFIIKKILSNSTIEVIVDKEGITDNSSAISLGFMSWEDIEQISIAEFNGDRYIQIHLKDEKKYLKKISMFKRIIVKLNKKMGFEVALISYNLTGIVPEQFIQAVEEYLNTGH